jgi:hypothetical protein
MRPEGRREAYRGGKVRRFAEEGIDFRAFHCLFLKSFDVVVGHGPHATSLSARYDSRSADVNNSLQPVMHFGGHLQERILAILKARAKRVWRGKSGHAHISPIGNRVLPSGGSAAGLKQEEGVSMERGVARRWIECQSHALL